MATIIYTTKDDCLQQICALICDHRFNRKWSHSKMAESMGISMNTITRIKRLAQGELLNDKHSIRLVTAFRYLLEFVPSVNLVFGITGKEGSPFEPITVEDVNLIYVHAVKMVKERRQKLDIKNSELAETLGVSYMCIRQTMRSGASYLYKKPMPLELGTLFNLINTFPYETRITLANPGCGAVPQTLYHATWRQPGNTIAPGIYWGAKFKKWGEERTNEHLYATPNSELAVIMAWAAWMEDKELTDGFRLQDNVITLISEHKLSVLLEFPTELYLYTIQTGLYHNWKVLNDEEWRTTRAVHYPKFRIITADSLREILSNYNICLELRESQDAKIRTLAT